MDEIESEDLGQSTDSGPAEAPQPTDERPPETPTAARLTGRRRGGPARRRVETPAQPEERTGITPSYSDPRPVARAKRRSEHPLRRPGASCLRAGNPRIQGSQDVGKAL